MGDEADALLDLPLRELLVGDATPDRLEGGTQEDHRWGWVAVEPYGYWGPWMRGH